MKKRMLSIVMALAMVLSLLPATAMAAGVTDCSGDDSCNHQAAITVGETTTHYDTLTEAIAASNSGDTIILLKDIDNSVDKDDYSKGVNYSLKAGTTLDGDGHTLSGHIGVYIPTAGATVKNVKFVNIHNNTVVDKDTCDYYGWESKTGNQSAIYASGLTGTATITGCTFDNIDWDAIQITPTKSASIVIQNNVFQHTNTTDTQLRYVHIQYTAGFLGVAIKELTITDNQFYVTENPKDSFCSVGVWKVNKNTTTLKLNGNYLEDPSSTEVTVIGTEYMFPSRSQATVDTDDYQPVAYDGSVVFDDLQQAVDQTTKYVKMMVDTAETAAIPEGKEIYFYSYGHAVGTITNNGSMQIYGSDLADSSQIVNNGTMSLSGNSATVYDIENNGTIKITSGTTYDLSKITGSGTVTITGGTFSTKPSDAQLAQWYKAVEQSGEPVTYKVSSMTMAEKVEAGVVATSSSSSGNCYTSVTQGVNATDEAKTYLQVDSDEDIVIRTPYSGGRSLYANKHRFTGSIVIQKNCDFLNLLGSEFDLKYVSGDRLRIGFYSTSADVTIQDADLDLLEVSASGDCTVTGGNYGRVIAHTYYDKKTDTQPKYTAELSITGGCFASDTVTRKYTDVRPEGVPASKEVPLSDFLPEGYTVVEGTGAYPYQVVKASDTAAAVVPAAPSVSAPEGADDLKAALEAAEDLVTGSGLDVAAGTKANENTLTAASEEVTGALETEGIDTTEKTVTIVIQPYMDVSIVEVSAEGENKTLKLDITPRYNVVATTANLGGENPEDIIIAGEGVNNANAAIVERALELTITQPVTVTIPLPDGFVTDGGANVYVKHTQDGEFVAYHEAIYTAGTAGNPDTLSFLNDKSFSTFEVIVDERSAQVTFGDAEQPTTLNAANVGEALPVPETPAGQVFDGWTFAGIEGTYKTLTDELLDQLSTAYAGSGTAIVATAAFHTPSGGGGGGGVSSYAITVEESENGAVTADKKSAAEDAEITLTVKPNEGYVLESLTVTDKDGKEIALTDKGEGVYTFAMPASKVTVKATFAEAPVSSELPFTDVDVDDWFYGAVEYVYNNKLMDGTSSTTFSPLMTTTRSMIVTILWRLEGQPQVNYAMTFEDVAGDTWYTEAVRWAASEGIVKGYSDTVFAPDDIVSREQLATILDRYAQYKEYDVTAKGDLTTFVDGDTVSSWAADGMTWAVGAELITGKDGGKLDPTGTATRAEVATMLMRFCENVAK